MMNEKLVESFVGIDVSKNTLDLRIEPAGEAMHLAYDDQGIAQICRHLAEAPPTVSLTNWGA